MAQHLAEVVWQRNNEVFLDNRYSRRHIIRFDGGTEVPGSASPHVVPLPFSDASAVDPEEMLVASLASCHMLWFLSIAAQRSFRVDSYCDEAVGLMGKNTEHKMAMVQVTLRPSVVFGGEKRPTQNEIEQMHHEAHDQCFIANSVTTKVCCEPIVDTV